jgi:hypothetical protein
MQTTTRVRLDLEWKSARIIISSFLLTFSLMSPQRTYCCVRQFLHYFSILTSPP